MNHTLKNIYNKYVEDHGEIDKLLFRDICEEFNIMIMDYILDGKEFNMGNNLSTLSIVRRDRDRPYVKTLSALRTGSFNE